MSGSACVRVERLNRSRTVARSRTPPAPDSKRGVPALPDPDRRVAARAAGAEERAGFVKRIEAYMLKAIHEAKVHSSWINPERSYDDAVQQYVGRILESSRTGVPRMTFVNF